MKNSERLRKDFNIFCAIELAGMLIIVEEDDIFFNPLNGVLTQVSLGRSRSSRAAFRFIYTLK